MVATKIELPNPIEGHHYITDTKQFGMKAYQRYILRIS